MKTCKQIIKKKLSHCLFHIRGNSHSKKSWTSYQKETKRWYTVNVIYNSEIYRLSRFHHSTMFGSGTLWCAEQLPSVSITYSSLSKGATMDLVDCMGRNIFHLCVQSTDLDIFHAIGEAAVEIGKSNSLVNLLDSVDYDGCTPFYLTVKPENKPFCKYLSWLGADVNAANPKNGNTALHHLILSNTYSNQLDIVKFLTEECHADV